MLYDHAGDVSHRGRVMGKILFLDDMDERHSNFIKATLGRGHEVVQVYRASEAIKKLGSEEFDQVFLDHDLSIDDIMVKVGKESKVPTGMTVVDHIMKMEKPPMDVIVHSCNGPAAWEMCYRLAEHPAKIRVQRLPFPELLRAIYASSV
jgi:CheY-like chemotaxis protein